MIDITLEDSFITFYSSVGGSITCNVELAEVVDDSSLHIGTNVGVFLINVNEIAINNIEFSNSTDAVNYILT